MVPRPFSAARSQRCRVRSPVGGSTARRRRHRRDGTGVAGLVHPAEAAEALSPVAGHSPGAGVVRMVEPRAKTSTPRHVIVVGVDRRRCPPSHARGPPARAPEPGAVSANKPRCSPTTVRVRGRRCHRQAARSSHHTGNGDREKVTRSSLYPKVNEARDGAERAADPGARAHDQHRREQHQASGAACVERRRCSASALSPWRQQERRPYQLNIRSDKTPRLRSVV